MDLPSFRDELIRDIERSHLEPGSSELQSSVLMRCMKFLQLDVTENECDLFSLPTIQPIAGHALIMFSFPGKTNSVVENRLSRSINSSKVNARGFYKCLSELRYRFVVLRHIPIAQVNQFLSIINKWIANRLKQKVEDGFDEMLAFECLQNPTILRDDADLLNATVSYYTKPELRLPEVLTPASIMFFVSDDLSLRNVGQNLISAAVNSESDPQVVDEFHFQLYRVQDAKHYTPEFSERFWLMAVQCLSPFDATCIERFAVPKDLEQLSQFTQIRLFPLARVLLNNILAQMETTLPILLRLLTILLRAFKLDFYKLSAGLHYRNFTDAILQSPVHSRLLQKAKASNDAKSLVDLSSWAIPFIESLAGAQKLAAAVTLCDYYVGQDIQCLNPWRLLLLTFDSTVLAQCRSEPLGFLRLSDARKLVSRHAKSIVSTAKNPSGSFAISATELIRLSLSYDIMFTAHNSLQLQKKEIPTLLDIDSSLWEALLDTPLKLQEMLSALLQSLNDVISIIIFKPRKNGSPDKDLEAAINMHNRDTKKLCTNISAILEKLALADPELMLAVLQNAASLMAMWNCIFSPETNQSALNILYLVYDAEGRYEAICGLLNSSIENNLAAIVDSFATITSMRAFEPCPKAVRILMDVTTALADPLSGILTTTSEKAQNCGQLVQLLWAGSWLFLVMIYQLTLVWATMYHLSDLVEFTRDVLDVSHSLLDSFRPILDFLGNPEVKGPLFGKFLKAFNHVIVWLRLGDLSLLNSCVNLVFKGFDLAKEMGVSVDREFLTTFVKYGAKAKKFNNKLTEQQREDVLAKASEFDEALVQSVVQEARQQRSASKEATITRQQPVEKGATYAYQSAKPKQSKQLLLTRFGVVSKEPPVAPAPPKPFKSNNLEAIRNELKNSRAPQKPASAPAPPRPAGFNSKRAPVVGRSLNALKHKGTDSDSSDEDDDDIDTSDLFLDSKKKSKITELDIHGNPVTKIAQNKRANQERREEERMRMRLNVNLKPLYSTILKWNYNSDSSFPTEERDIYQPIKDSYTDVKEYVKLTEPLLMLECWQGIQSSRTTGQELPVQLLVGSRTTCDGFFDVYASIKKADLSTRKIGETDLMVLGYVADKGIEHANDVSQYLKRLGSQTCLAKVRNIKHANSDYCDITLRVYPQGSMMGLLTPKTVIVGMKVMQMITVEREFSSLKGLPYYDLCEEILAGTPSKPVEISDDDAKAMVRQNNVNISQAKAILASAKAEGFSLIQGPPGTGKTKTILGIVGHFLSSTRAENTIRIPTPSSSVSRSTTPEEAPKGPKVLICAPSNAAVDELVVRLRDGIVDSKGASLNPKIVRLGRSDAINQAVRDLSLEELIERQLSVRTTEAKIDPGIRSEHTKCIAERDKIREELKRGDLKDEKIIELETKLREINKKRSELGKRLDDQRENASIAYRTREIERRQIQAKILSEAQIICSTLSGSAHDFVASMSMKFDQVIIDEACQCVELSAIIPLRYGCKKCIMVGDPNQLPPTVLSQKAASYNYEESLFVRMQRRHPNSVYLLDVQYRMHPDISKFPSAQFYNSKLTDGSGMLQKNSRPWHNEYPFTPYRFFDIVSRHLQSERTKSFFNYSEAQVALELVQKLMDILPTNQFKGRIGIISPYKEQIRTLRDVFIKKYGSTILAEIDFNTVDGFQGQEKEIIIMSCVRASETGSVGFLSDVRRMNVALTRARTTLWILGNKSSLRRDKVWSRLISDAESRHCMTSAEPGFLKRIEGNPDLGKSKSSESIAEATSPIATETTVPDARKKDASRTAVPKRRAEKDVLLPYDPEPPHKKKSLAVFKQQASSNNSSLPKKPKVNKSGIYIHNSRQNTAAGTAPMEQNVQPAALPNEGKELVEQKAPKAINSGVYAPPAASRGNGNRKKSSDVFIRRRGNSGRPPNSYRP